MSTSTETAVLNLIASGKFDEMMASIRDGILTNEVIAAYRLPIPVRQLAKITKAFPGDHIRMKQCGEWLLFIDTTRP